MTELRLILFLGAVLFEFILVMSVYMAYRRKLAVWTIAALILAPQALGLVTFAAGGELQAGYSFWSRLLRLTESPPYEPFSISGDPGLRRMVAAQPRTLPRPDSHSSGDIASWQESIRPRLRRDVFKLPAIGVRSPSERFVVLSTAELPGGIRRQFVKFSSFDGTAIPGYLFYTPNGPRRPAIIVISGHGYGIIETAGLTRSYQNSVALQLARKGFVTFTPELRGFGYLGAREGLEHRAVARNALEAGTFYKAVVLRDLTIALDRMADLPQVDGRLAATGVSYGGELALALTALDTRIKVAVVQGYGGEYTGTDMGNSGGEFSVCDHFCHLVPQLNRYVDEDGLSMLVAPRPLMVVRGQEEGLSGSLLWPKLKNIYRSYGTQSSFQFVEQPGYHEYWLEPAIPFFLRHLPLDVSSQ